jgi:hypothetical protein
MTKELLCPLTFISGRRWPTSAVCSLPAALRSSSPDAEPPLPPAWHARRQGGPSLPIRASHRRTRNHLLRLRVVDLPCSSASSCRRQGKLDPPVNAGERHLCPGCSSLHRRGGPAAAGGVAQPSLLLAAGSLCASLCAGARRPPWPLPPLRKAFEERGDAILHLLSPPMQFSSPICIVCWRLCLT